MTAASPQAGDAAHIPSLRPTPEKERALISSTARLNEQLVRAAQVQEPPATRVNSTRPATPSIPGHPPTPDRLNGTRPHSTARAAPSALAVAALGYRARGWWVVPLHSPTKQEACSCERVDCASPAKHPRTRHGLKDASRDTATIRRWLEQYPEANIGILTGPESGILVLDVDGKQGEESLAELSRRGFALPDTYCVSTGRGSHFYFEYPAGLDIRNSAGKAGNGLDIRGAGGYVVAPPSRHISGTVYRCGDPGKTLAPVPEWLLSLIQGPSNSQTRQSATTAGTVATFGKGQRRPLLFRLAGKMRREGVPLETIEQTLLAMNATFNPPVPEADVRKTAAGVLLYRGGDPEKTAAAMKPDVTRLADVNARAVDWLWQPLIPLGMLTMISGDPGAGKSFVALAVSADLSQGKLRDGRVVDPASTLYLSVENPLEQCIRPRFDALGGDPARFFALKGTVFEGEGGEEHGAVTLADLPILDQAISETKAKLVIVDPIQSYLGASVDLHRSNETRPVLDGLSKLAERHDCAVLILRHLSKQSGGKAIHRGLGSIDLTGAVRSELLAGSLPDNAEARALIQVKSNVGRIGNPLGYSIDSDGRFAWTGESQITASDLLGAPEAPEDRSACDDAAEWLRDFLSEGSREQPECRKRAEAAGIAFATLRRAKNTLRVRSVKGSVRGAWLWCLPEPFSDSQASSIAAEEPRLPSSTPVAHLEGEI
jgi:hypothetical protein